MAVQPQDSPLATPLNSLWKVGDERSAQLARLELHTVEDLLLYKPRRHEDRRHFRQIRDLKHGEHALVRGQIIAHGIRSFRKRNLLLYEFVLDDGTGLLRCHWWNAEWMKNMYSVGQEVTLFGKVSKIRHLTMDRPEVELVERGEEGSIHMGRIVPIYPLTEGLTQRWLRALVWRTLRDYAIHFNRREEVAIPAGLPTRAEAVRWLHFPDEMEQVEAARQRLALDEWLELQLQIQMRRQKLESRARGLACRGDNHLIKPFLANLGFKLTEAQTRVLREIRQDMGGGVPMRRLLQGDVGSGKTVVAACTALMALESGYNVALMAPTEILAIQHYENFRRWFEPLRVRVRLLTGGRKDYGDSELEENLPLLRSMMDGSQKGHQSGSACLVVGTHALVQPGLELERLGLVIIDEQHKFGVAQREALVRKGNYPHLLVMTATPIPRTLGLTLYGDLDVSIIDQLPPGRGRVRTFVRGADKLPKVWEFVRKKLAEGRQAYVVYPRLEEADTANEIKAVTVEHAKLVTIFKPWQVGLMHGKLPAAEKERTLADFREGRLHVLLATSVVEAGVDVPNATIMVVENADLFGLAQLHQLRGRIGRGAQDAFCIFVARLRTPDAIRRLGVLAQTNDGFRIAEADLELRGPGELLGQEQSGLPRFRFADFSKDIDLVKMARTMAKEALKEGADGQAKTGNKLG